MRDEGREMKPSALSTVNLRVGVPALAGPDRLKAGLQPPDRGLTQHWPVRVRTIGANDFDCGPPYAAIGAGDFPCGRPYRAIGAGGFECRAPYSVIGAGRCACRRPYDVIGAGDSRA
jgi:hypothetical protein